MSGGRRHPVDQRAGQFPANVARVAAEAGHRESVRAEHFRFGHVGGRIQVQKVGRCAVGLVPRNAAVFVRPGHPGLDELQVQLAERPVAIVCDSAHDLRVAFAGQFRRMIVQVIAPPRLELLQEVGTPIAPVFERVVVLGPGQLDPA